MSINPWDTNGWKALHRESTLVRNLLGSGITALGKANHAEKSGEYYTAFFNLSIGIERLAKLILATDYSISNNGKLPPQNEVKKYGHKINELINEIDKISKKNSLKLDYEKPANPISIKIIECLCAFADAKQGRYANFEALADPIAGMKYEPISQWWAEVAELILQQHYNGTAAQIKLEGVEKPFMRQIVESSAILFFKENGVMIRDINSLFIHGGKTKYVQKFGRFHTLTVIRWMSDIFNNLCKKACNELNIIEFYGHHEFFLSYTVNDSFLKSRKIWPLT